MGGWSEWRTQEPEALALPAGCSVLKEEGVRWRGKEGEGGECLGGVAGGRGDVSNGRRRAANPKDEGDDCGIMGACVGLKKRLTGFLFIGLGFYYLEINIRGFLGIMFCLGFQY